MSKWQDIRDKAPTLHTKVWGYDTFYGNVELVVWHGDTNDYGEPRLLIVNCSEDDDNNFLLWTAAEIPYPSKEEIDATDD